MSNYEISPQDYWFGQPAIPSMQPVFGAAKLWEMENDYSYLKYLYPDICSRINAFIDDECDPLEYEGSFIFDEYPDKTTLQQLAHKILKRCHEDDPDTFPLDDKHIREMIEIVLYNELLFRRNRYRNRKRLYI